MKNIKFFISLTIAPLLFNVIYITILMLLFTNFEINNWLSFSFGLPYFFLLKKFFAYGFKIVIKKGASNKKQYDTSHLEDVPELDYHDFD